MSDYTVRAILTATDNGYSRTMDKAAEAAAGLGNSVEKAQTGISKQVAIGNVAARVVTKAIGAITSSLNSAIKRVDTMNNFPKVMESLGFTADQANDSINKLSRGIEGLPTTLDEIVSNTQQLTAALDDLDAGTNTAIALNDMFLAGGQGADAASRALTQYNQMLAKSKVDQQSWNTLIEVAPGQMKQLAKELLGASANQKDLYNALQDGTIAMSDLNTAIIRLDTEGGEGFSSFHDQAMAATGGIGTALTNLGSAVTKGVANIIKAVNEGLAEANIPGISDSLGALKTVVNKVFSTAATVVKAFASNIKIVAAAVGPLSAGIVALKVIDSIKAKFKKFKDQTVKNADAMVKYRDAVKKYGSAQTALEKSEKTATAAAKYRTKANEAAEKASKAAVAAKEKERIAEEAQTKALSSGAKQEEAAAAAKKASAAAAAAKREAVKQAAAAEEAEAVATRLEAKASNEAAAAQEMQNTQITVGALLSAVMTKKIGIMEAAQIGLNAAFEANPIGFVVKAISLAISAATALTTVINKLTGDIGKASNKYKELSEQNLGAEDAANEAAIAMRKETSAIDNEADSVDSLVSELDSLYKGEANTAEERARIATITERLNALQEDLNVEYNQETGLLSESTAAYKRRSKVAESTKKVTALQEQLAQAQDNLNNEMANEAEIQHQLESGQEAYNKVTAKGSKIMSQVAKASKLAQGEIVEGYENNQKALEESKNAQVIYAEEIERITNELTAAQEEKKAATLAASAAEAEAIEDLKDKYVAYYGEMSESIAQKIAEQTVKLEDLTEANQQTANDLKTIWQGYVDAATNMFDRLSDDSILSVDEMISNIQENQRVVSDWGDNMATIRNKLARLGLDSALADQLQTLGVEGAGYVAELVNATDDQMRILAESFAEGGEIATQSLYNSIGGDAAEQAKQIEGIVTEMQTNLSEALRSADWTEVPRDIMDGFAEGLSDDEDLVAAVKESSEDIIAQTKKSFDSHSPSRVYYAIGQDVNEGLANGLEETTKQPVSVISTMAEKMTEMMTRLVNKMFTFGQNAGSGFSRGLSGMASTVQSAAQTIADSASKTIQKALEIHSPSRLFEKFGRYTGEGFVNGIESMQRAVQNASQSMADIAAGIVIPSYNTASSESYVISGNGTAAGGGAAAEYSIDLSMIVNGREFAKATVDDYNDVQNMKTTRANRLKGALA